MSTARWCCRVPSFSTLSLSVGGSLFAVADFTRLGMVLLLLSSHCMAYLLENTGAVGISSPCRMSSLPPPLPGSEFSTAA